MTKTDTLRRHMRAVEAAMRATPGDWRGEERWAVLGLSDGI